MAVSTLLSLPAWEKALSSHTDMVYAQYVCQDLRWDLRVGLKHGSPLRPAQANMESANQHPDVISVYLHKECSLGHMQGFFWRHSNCHISRFGVIPKGHNTGKFRLINDLYFPLGQSVNDGIDLSLCSLVYTTADEVAAQAEEPC